LHHSTITHYGQLFLLSCLPFLELSLYSWISRLQLLLLIGRRINSRYEVNYNIDFAHFPTDCISFVLTCLWSKTLHSSCCMLQKVLINLSTSGNKRSWGTRLIELPLVIQVCIIIITLLGYMVIHRTLC